MGATDPAEADAGTIRKDFAEDKGRTDIVELLKAHGPAAAAGPEPAPAEPIPEPEPRLFSFNNPAGACPTCDGLVVEQFFDPDKVVLHPEPSPAG